LFAGTRLRLTTAARQARHLTATAGRPGTAGCGLSKETLDAVFNRLRQKTTASPPKETIHATQQPGDGYWAIAPGASDISEGMVWAKPVEVDGGAVRR